MRIIGGEFGGRRFNPPANKWPTRPTTDFAKEGLYNILQNRIDFEEVVMLDLFGGAGSHSYEFISRGCSSVTYVDKFRPCVSFVQSTVKLLGVEDKITILQKDVFKFIAEPSSSSFDIIFADPPYDHLKMSEIPNFIFQSNLLNDDGLLIIEHSSKTSFSHPRLEMSRSYGGCVFSFFKGI